MRKQLKEWRTVLVGALIAAGALVLAFVSGEWFRQREKARAQKALADDLKAKVAEVKAQRAEEKAAVATEVAKVEKAAEQEKARDSVDVANDLIAAARADAGKSSKG